MHNLQHTIQQFFSTYKLLPQKTHIVVAVSGGIDSMVLLHALHQLQVPCTVAHCNFQLRSEESTRDEFFVQQVAEQLQVPYLITHFNTKAYATEKGMGIQEAARILRYQWFEEQRKKIAEQLQIATVIATAHHANDVVETALFNFTRGTGIGGLHGIAAFQNNIIRPFATVFKKDIELYAKEQQLQWLEDSSNSSNKYSRNNIRNNILPLLEQQLPQATENIYHTVQHVQAAEKVYRFTIEKIVKKLLLQKGKEYQIAINGLEKHIFFDALFFELITKFGFTSKQIQELKKLLHAHTGSYMANDAYKVINNRGWLIFTPITTTQSSFIQIDENTAVIEFEEGKISLSTCVFSSQLLSNTKPNIAYINANLIEWPLTIRKPKTGDYFYPLGLNKKKKLSRFFIDQKLSATDKEKIWIVESNQKIIWVIGLRIDHRFSINKNCNNILQLSWAINN